MTKTTIALAICVAQPVAGQSTSRQAVLVIGELDAPETHVFGSITALEVDAKGSVFVLDGMSSELRWFDAHGNFRSVVGGEGGGPGEFRMALALAFDGEGVLNVLDPGNMKISRFRAAAGLLEHIDDQRIGAAFDLCIVGDRRLILFPTAGGIIHELDSGGRIVRSFGAPLTASEGSSALPPDLRMDLLNRGDLECDPDGERVVIASERTGRVAAYALSGSSLWQTQLADFKPVRWISTGDGRFQMAGDPTTGAASSVRAVTTDETGNLLVTVHEGSVENPEGRLVTKILNGTTGHEVRSEPAFAAWVRYRGGALYGVQLQPYPRVVKVLAN